MNAQKRSRKRSTKASVKTASMPTQKLTPKELEDKVLSHILIQVARDCENLKALPHADWHKRVRASVNSFIPDLIKYAPELIKEVSDTLNSPASVRRSWQELQSLLIAQGVSKEIKDVVARMESEFRQEEALTKVTGASVSSAIAQFWRRVRPDIHENGSSSYPDLFFADYTKLPKRTKQNVSEPAVRGAKPTNVPDGIEIKSQRGKRISVDSHHAHRGMHLALTFGSEKGKWVVHDVYIAYLSEAEYRESARNTPASTVKFSFKHAPFISVTTGETKAAVEESSDAEPPNDSDSLSEEGV